MDSPFKNNLAWEIAKQEFRTAMIADAEEYIRLMERAQDAGLTPEETVRYRELNAAKARAVRELVRRSR